MAARAMVDECVHPQKCEKIHLAYTPLFKDTSRKTQYDGGSRSTGCRSASPRCWPPVYHYGFRSHAWRP